METNKYELLIVIMSLGTGGAEKSLVNFLNLIDLDKYNVDLQLFRNEGEFISKIPQNVNLIKTQNSLEYCYKMMDINGLKSIRAIRSFLIRIIGSFFCSFIKKPNYEKKQIRWKYFYNHTIEPLQQEYDIAISFLEGEVGWYVINKVKAKKKIMWIHTDYQECHSNICLEEGYFQKANNVVSISEKCVDKLRKYYPSMTDKFVMLPNLISSSFLQKMAEEPIDVILSTKCKLLSIGRLTNVKGFDMAIDAADKLRRKGHQFVWYIIGDGELKQFLQERIDSNHLAEYVKLLGVKTNPYPYIKACDIFIQTSRYEGKSMVLDEAKILGKPIVVTEYATVYDQITNISEGLIVPMNSIGIATGIESLLKNEDIRKKYSAYLLDHEYGNENCIEKYYDLMTCE